MNLDWTSYQSQAQAIWAIPNAPLALAMLAVAGVLFVLLPGKKKPVERVTDKLSQDRDRPLPATGRPGFIYRSFHQYERPLRLQGHTYEVHERLIGIASIPGTGKSALLSEMMWQSGGRCIAISGGKSPPLIDTVLAMGGYHWETTGTLGMNLLTGDYRRVPQVLENMYQQSAGDAGLFRAMFRQITRDRLKEEVEAGIPWSFESIIDALRKARSDRYPGITPAMIGNWTARMVEVIDSLGPAIGTDLDVAAACEAHIPVLFTLDKRRDPSGTLRRMFAAAAMSAAMQAVHAGHAPMVLVDELGLLDAAAIAEDARTVREAGVLFAAAAHGKQDFGPDLRSLIDFWIFGTLAADEPETRHWASATTFGTKTPEAFGGHALPKGHFVVWDGQRVDDTLTVPRYKPRLKRSYASEPTHLKPTESVRRRTIVREVAPPWLPPNALPAPRLEVQTLLEQIDRSGECWLWLGRKDRDGYGLVWWQGQNRRAHRIVYEQIHGLIALGEDGKPLDLDHRRTCPRHCVNPGHLEAVTRAENVRRRWRVRGVGARGI